jgi:hypothetical protein
VTDALRADALNPAPDKAFGGLRKAGIGQTREVTFAQRVYAAGQQCSRDSFQSHYGPLEIKRESTPELSAARNNFCSSHADS